MLFSSPRFFLFVAALLGVLSLPTSVTTRKRILAAASCIFYAAWDYRYLGLLLLISVIDYAAAERIHASSDPRVRRGWLAASVVSNLGILGYFKYTNFFLETVNSAFGASVPYAAILLPAGISFYTFKSMSYTIDVHRREITPCRSWLDYTTFITFFPELIAGPIVRASVFLPQLDRPIGYDRARFREGAALFLLGLTKKLVIADRMAVIADQTFAHPDRYAALTLWCGAFAYAIQIYADFSGYSDMAIGVAKVIGYDLPENFAMPYGSRNITEFWRRWHITLSSWLRDYLYIPLGGNRSGPVRTYVNLALTMLLGGLWHGASWNFVLWGALHGVALAFHRAISRSGRQPLSPALTQPLTLLFVVLCWVPFRATSFATTVAMLRGLMGAGPGRVSFVPFPLLWVGAAVVAAHVVGQRFEAAAKVGVADRRVDAALSRVDAYLVRSPISGWSVAFRARTVLGAFVVVAWLAFVLFAAVFTNNPFVYFQF